MILEPKETTVAFRCPECGTATYGFAGKFTLHAGLVRLKCSCGGSHLDLTAGKDGKMRLSVPCLYCKQNHNYVVSDTIFFGRDLFLLNCPYSGMDIGFIGEREQVDEAVRKSGEQLVALLKNLETEKLADIQPQDTAEDDILPDPTAYDCIRFLIRDLEEDGKIDCPCHIGTGYDLRFIKNGIEVFCPECGAVHAFHVDSASSAESYLDTDTILLEPSDGEKV